MCNVDKDTIITLLKCLGYPTYTDTKKKKVIRGYASCTARGDKTTRGGKLIDHLQKIAEAEDRIGRGLTSAECKKILPISEQGVYKNLSNYIERGWVNKLYIELPEYCFKGYIYSVTNTGRELF